MRLNLYDILFYAIYVIMRRQGNRNPEDDEKDGLVGGSIFLTLVPLFLYLDIVMIIKHFSPVRLTPGKPVLIIFFILMIVVNLLVFGRRKRYLRVRDEFSLMDKGKRMRFLLPAWTFIGLLTLVFFTFAFLKFKTY